MVQRNHFYNYPYFAATPAGIRLRTSSTVWMARSISSIVL